MSTSDNLLTPDGGVRLILMALKMLELASHPHSSSAILASCLMMQNCLWRLLAFTCLSLSSRYAATSAVVKTERGFLAQSDLISTLMMIGSTEVFLLREVTFSR